MAQIQYKTFRRQVLGASHAKDCVPGSPASAWPRRHRAGEGEQAASALQGCTSDTHRLLTLPPDFCWRESGTFCNNSSSKNCIRGNNPCLVARVPQHLPPVSLTQGQCSPGYLPPRSASAGSRWSPGCIQPRSPPAGNAGQCQAVPGSCHPPQGKAHPITQPDPHIHLLL